MTAALRGSVRAQWRTSRVPTAVDGARPRPARNSAATPSYPLDRSIISGLFQFLEPNYELYSLCCKISLCGVLYSISCIIYYMQNYTAVLLERQQNDTTCFLCI